MQSLCVCVTLYYQHPEMIEMELPQRRDAEEGGADGAVYVLTRDGFPSLPSDAQTTSGTCGLTDNLPIFQLVPKNSDGNLVLSGEELLKHMPKYVNQHVDGDESYQRASNGVHLTNQ